MRPFIVLLTLILALSSAACRSDTPPPPTPIRPAPSVTAGRPTNVPPTTAPPTATRPAATAVQATATQPAATATQPPTQPPPTQPPPTQPPPTSTTAPPTARPATPTPPTQAQSQPTLRPVASPTRVSAGSLRGIDWATVLKTDPKLEYDASVPNFGQPLGPYVRLRGATPTGAIEGHAVTNSVLYGDISGDGREEAVIPLNSGGTAGLLGYLVYREIDGQPVLMTGLPGYKVGAKMEAGELRISQPLYGANDANCCPSGVEETAYRLQGDRLARVREPVSRGFPEMKRPVVERFCTLLSVKDYPQAYEQLSPAYKASRPYAQWVAGYQTTLAVDAKVLDRQDGLLGIDLTATDRTATGQVTRRFSGTWSLVWSPEKKQWLMDRGILNEVK